MFKGSKGGVSMGLETSVKIALPGNKSLSFETIEISQDGRSKDFTIRGKSAIRWDKPFGIPFLTLSGLELDARFPKTGARLVSIKGTTKIKGQRPARVVGRVLFAGKRIKDVQFSLPEASLGLGFLPGIKDIPGADTFSIKNPVITKRSIGTTPTSRN